VSLFEKEATKGTDPDLKAYAAKTLPTLKDHLKMAQDLQASVKQ
jgi:putative membrane protein